MRDFYSNALNDVSVSGIGLNMGEDGDLLLHMFSSFGNNRLIETISDADLEAFIKAIMSQY